MGKTRILRRERTKEKMREKLEGFIKLKRLPKLDKVAYGMLSVPSIIAAVLFIAAVAAGLYAIKEGMGDSNGGGWLIFIVLLMWIGCFPALAACCLQAIFWYMCMRKGIKGQWKMAREMGIVSAVVGIVLPAFVLLLIWKEAEYGLLLAISIFGILYYGVIIFLLAISMKKQKNEIKKNYKVVLFDFDYTLGDSTNGIAKSIEYALAQLGEQSQEIDKICKTIGMTLKDAYRTLTGNMDEERAVRFEMFFKQKADEVMVEGTKLYEPTRGVIEVLREQGCMIGIVTTKYHYRIDDILAKFGMGDMVDVIVGGDDVRRQKPSPDGLLHAIDKLKVADEEVLYVGDTVIDAKAAKNANVDFVAVLTGTTESEAFAGCTVKMMFEDLRGVVDFVRAQ